MKKLLVFVLIALCCLSVFAEVIPDSSVRVTFGLNEAGWGFKEGTVSLRYSFSGDKAYYNFYTDYVIKPECNWNGLAVHFDCKVLPVDYFSLTAGTQTFINFSDLKSTELLFFVRPQLDFAANGKYYAEIGYSSSIFDFSKKNYYTYGNAKLVEKEEDEYFIDVAGLVNFTFENGKLDVSLLNAEAAYCPDGSNYPRKGCEYGVPGITGINYQWVAGGLSWSVIGNEYVFDPSYFGLNASQRKVALRYKYSKDNTPEENGVFAFVEARNHEITDTTSFTAIFEIGRYGVDAEVGVMDIKDSRVLKADTNFAMHVVDGEFGIDVSYVGLKASDYFGNVLEDSLIGSLINYTQGSLQLDYYNSADRAERDNGLFLTGFTAGNVGAASVSPSAKVGLTKLENSPKFVYDFNLNLGISY